MRAMLTAVALSWAVATGAAGQDAEDAALEAAIAEMLASLLELGIDRAEYDQLMAMIADMGDDAEPASVMEMITAFVEQAMSSDSTPSPQQVRAPASRAATASATVASTAVATPKKAAGAGAVAPGSYPAREDVLLGHPACAGYTVENYKSRFAANSEGNDVQLHTMCAQSYDLFASYNRAIAQGYSRTDSDLTYDAYMQAALNASHFYEMNVATPGSGFDFTGWRERVKRWRTPQ